MWQALQTHRVLFVSFAMLMLGTGLQNTLIGLRAAAEGFSSAATGLIMASFYLGYLVSALSAGRYIARVGHIRVFAAASALCSITILLHGMLINAWLWVVIRFITGFCISGLYIICESWLNAQSGNHQRGQAMAAYIIVIYVSQSAGQLFFTISGPESLLLFLVASIAISLASIPLLLTRIKTPQVPETQNSMSMAALYRRSPLGTTGIFAASFSSAALNSLMPVYAAKTGLNEQYAGYLVIALNAGCILLMSPAGKLSDIFDRRLVITLCAAFSAATALGTALLSGSFPLLLILVALLGGFSLPLSSLSSAYVNDWLQADEIVPAASTIMLVAGAGSIFGPLVAGGLMDWFSPEAFFYITCAVMLAFTLFACYRMTRRSVQNSGENVQAIHMSTLTAVGLAQAYDQRQLSFDFSGKSASNTST